MMTQVINALKDDDWLEEEIFSGEKRKVECFNFTDDTLALVCGCLRTGHDLVQTFTTVEQVGKKQISIKDVINSEDRELANKIRSYFKNRIITRRLKNQYISKWMEKTEAVLETPNELREDYISLLVKLPDFYQENTEREAIFKKHVSMSKPVNTKISIVELNSLVSFAGSVERSSKSEKHVTFYFSTEDNHLVAVDVERSNIGYKLWNWLAHSNQSFRLKSESVQVTTHPGYEFYHIKLNPNYEIENT